MKCQGVRPRQPAWAASPYFAPCWAALWGSAAADGPPDDVERELASLRAMAECRVIAIDDAQVNALPASFDNGGPTEHGNIVDGYWTLGDRIERLQLPFESVFIDLGGASLEPRSVDRVLGVLCFVSGGRVVLRPFLRAPQLPGSCFTYASVFSLPEEPGVRVIPVRARAAYDRSRGAMEAKQITVEAVERAVTVLEWMQSVNVEVVPAALTKSERRKAERKGREVALTVQVKQSRRRLARSTGSRADFSHRFEVRGHYTHHFREKPDGSPNRVFERYARLHPEKVLQVEGRDCVRFWTPPYVKGPADKPLVPKLRVTA